MAKKRPKSHLALLMLLSTLLASAGQLLFKLGLSSNGLILLVCIGTGALAYGISTIAYLYTLSRSHLSWSYDFVGLSYVFTTILAAYFLGEAVGLVRAIGVTAIMVGTLFVGMS